MYWTLMNYHKSDMAGGQSSQRCRRALKQQNGVILKDAENTLNLKCVLRRTFTETKTALILSIRKGQLIF